MVENSRITDDGLKHLLALTGALPNLIRLEILDGDLHGASLEGLSNFLEHTHHKLDFLSLCGNRLGDIAAVHIADAITNHSIQRLHVGFNQFGGSIARLAKAISRDHFLSVLNLDANMISETMLSTFAAALRTSSLTSFSVAHNKLGSFSMHSVAKLLTGPLRHLRSINLASNGIGNTGVQVLGTSVRDHRSLQELYLDANEIGERGSFIIASWLPTNGALKILSLENNSITNYGAKSIEQALESNGQIVQLSLLGNPISEPEILTSIESLLARNRAGRGPSNRDGSWAEWGPCDVSCGFGLSHRWCTNPTPSGWGELCDGIDDLVDADTTQCYSGPCPGEQYLFSCFFQSVCVEYC